MDGERLGGMFASVRPTALPDSKNLTLPVVSVGVPTSGGNFFFRLLARASVAQFSKDEGLAVDSSSRFPGPT